MSKFSRSFRRKTITFKITANQFSFYDNRGDALKTGQTTISPSSDAKPESYPGGSLEVEVYKEDAQRDFVWRGLYKHAEAAGLPHDECVKFAEKWTTDELLHQADGTTRAYMAKEFAQLKAKGAGNFDLDERYSPDVLNDLRQRQADYAASRRTIQNSVPSMSAPQLNDAERAVKWMTDTVDAVTGSENEVGKQFNRLSVSGLRLMGQLQDMQNKATETITDAVRYVAPDAVDRYLDKYDETQNNQANALKNARSVVTNNDTADDLMAAKAGIKRPLAEDLHRKLMYFPEAIPNAIDSAIKGDFKDDDGSYSDRVGKIIGGLNPAGDVRDIVANGKKVIQGDGKATIPLIASIVGGVPGAGDVAKPIIKEVGKELTEKAIKEVGGETVEKLAKEEVEQTIKQTGKLEIEPGRTFTEAEKRFAERKLLTESMLLPEKKVTNIK